MSVRQYTAFWKGLGIDMRRRAKISKAVAKRPKSDIAVLRKAGVSQEVIDDVYNTCLGFDDELFFKKFSKFFRKDIAAVKTWTRTTSASKAFKKLFDIFCSNDIEEAKKQFSKLALVFEYYRKGEGQVYKGKLPPGIKIRQLASTNIRRRFSLVGGTSEYKERGVTDFGKARLIWIQKNTDGKITNKFIKISALRSTVEVTLSMDSKKEYYIAKGEIERKLNTILETPQEVKDLNRLYQFLRNGTSAHFTLSGCTYIDSEFRISILPSHSRIENVSQLQVYRKKLDSNKDKLSIITQLRLSYSDKRLTRPIFISVLSLREGIFGAILLKPDDKGLSATTRSQLQADFLNDFGISLNYFITYDNLDLKTIYNNFLTTLPSRALKIELRSNRALEIYKVLLSDGLLQTDSSSEETSKLCINSICHEYFKPVWGSKKYCSKCKEILINGKTVEVKSIDELDIAKFIKSKCKNGTVTVMKKKLLSRDLHIAQCVDGDDTVDFICISRILKESQIELIKYRFPHAVIVTTRNDKLDYIGNSIQAINLSELAENVYEEDGAMFPMLLSHSRRRSLSAMRTLCNTSIDRVNNTPFYKDRNSETKNLGAELFEADCSILFDYVFGNCIWLGAKYRGQSLPDGFTAFPMLESDEGCFIWDGKFSEGPKLVMGDFSKNKKYIEEASTNASIKRNGGLRGFVFISNNTFPKSFIKKYSPLVNGKRIKIAFIRADQFQRIAEHYRANERKILNSIKARRQFSASMVDIFFTTVKGRKCEIVTDALVDKHILRNEAAFALFRGGGRLTT